MAADLTFPTLITCAKIGDLSILRHRKRVGRFDPGRARPARPDDTEASTALRLPIYMDAHATTPVDPRVLAKMLPFFVAEFGNAASHGHAHGRRAREAIETAREEVARHLSATPEEIVWTSGATESNNLALIGAAEAAREKGDHVVTCATEHRAVLDPARHLARHGFEVTLLEVDSSGELDPQRLRAALRRRTILVSLMMANNEIGTIHPLAELARIVHEHSSALLHTDAAQAAGLIPIDTRELDVDLLSLSGHKIHGPKGIGALFVRRRRPRLRLEPLLHGGGHERGLRSGTANVPGIVGLGEASAIARSEGAADARHCRRLRDDLLRRITADVPDVEVNGGLERRLPNNLNVSFRGVAAAEVLLELTDVSLSTGAACSSATLEPSHVLAALGHGPGRVQSSVRFGLSKFNTDEEVRYVAGRVAEAIDKLRTAGTLDA